MCNFSVHWSETIHLALNKAQCWESVILISIIYESVVGNMQCTYEIPQLTTKCGVQTIQVTEYPQWLYHLKTTPHPYTELDVWFGICPKQTWQDIHDGESVMECECSTSE